VKTLEEVCEEVILENKIMDWIYDHSSIVKDAFKEWVDKHGGPFRTAAAGVGALTVGAISPITMAAYFHKFFKDNPETLTYPDKFLQMAAQFLADHPEIIETLKKVTGAA
jgi:hypothetical protein